MSAELTRQMRALV